MERSFPGLFCARRISYKYSPPERGGSLFNCNKQLLWHVRASRACVHHWRVRTTGNSLIHEKRLPGYPRKPHGLSCLADLNCRPPPYQGDALPAEPRQRTHLLCFSNLQYNIMDQHVCQRKKQKNLNKFFIQKDQFLGKPMEVQTQAGNTFRSAFIFCSKKDIEVLICQKIQHQCRNRRARIRRRL